MTDCLNFGSPETGLGAWQLERAIDGIADACRALDVPVVSGNVSLYNETPVGPILPTPVIGTVGLLEDRGAAVPMRWSDGDELWLLGELGDDAGALAASELAWCRRHRDGMPHLDVATAARVPGLLASLARQRTVAGGHDASFGGLGLALARMAIASGIGASVELPGERPTAALFGERAGRVVLAVEPHHGADVQRAADGAGVSLRRIGRAGGHRLEVALGGTRLTADVEALGEAWRTAF